MKDDPNQNWHVAVGEVYPYNATDKSIVDHKLIRFLVGAPMFLHR